jgi:hypothetical protein
MSTAFPYQIKGARGSYNAEINGFDFTVFIVLTEVVGSTDIDQLYNALTDGNVPLAGADLFDLTGIVPLTGCWLRKIDTGAISNGQMDLTLTYQQSQWGILQIDAGSQVSQVQTTKYLSGPNAGNPATENIKLEYTYPSDYGGDKPTEEEKGLRGATKEQGGTVQVLLPEPSRVYTVRQDLDPTTQASLFVGKVNNAVWFLGAARTWLCTSITGTSDNSGVLVTTPTNWVNRYEFQFKSDGWDPEVVYSDVLTNEPVPDPVEDESIKTIESYDEVDFELMFPGF